MTCKILLLLLFQNLSTMAENYVPLVTREFLQSLGTVKLVPFWLELFYLIAGVYIIFKIHILPHPPYWFIFLPQIKIIIMRKIVSLSFWNFVYFKSIGENMHFPPFFHPLSIFFFPNMLFGRFFCLLSKQKNIHPCLEVKQMYLSMIDIILIYLLEKRFFIINF